MKNARVIFIESCVSTQEHARKLIQMEKDVTPLVVVTDSQTAGRGRGENSWESEPGQNLLCTIVYPYRQKADKQSYISRAVSLALCDLLMLFTPNYAIKWPNDIVLDGKKIAGILIEHQVSGSHLTYSLIGIGLNVNQERFPEVLQATSLIHATETKFRLKDILRTLLSCLESRLFLYESQKWNELDEQYHQHLLGYRKNCRFFSSSDDEFEAVVKGVDEYGRIILEHDGRTHAYDLNEVHMQMNK